MTAGRGARPSCGFEAGYSRTCRDPSRNATLADATIYGIAPQNCSARLLIHEIAFKRRFREVLGVRRGWILRSCPPFRDANMLPTRTTETGARDDHPDTVRRTAPDASLLREPLPRPLTSVRNPTKKSGPNPSNPVARSPTELGGGGGSLERTRLAATFPPHRL